MLKQPLRELPKATNSIHAGELQGRKARYVVVMEFHSGVIEDAFSKHGLHFRSPFGLR